MKSCAKHPAESSAAFAMVSSLVCLVRFDEQSNPTAREMANRHGVFLMTPELATRARKNAGDGEPAPSLSRFVTCVREEDSMKLDLHIRQRASSLEFKPVSAMSPESQLFCLR